MKRYQRGFTLAEMLIALSVSVLLVALVYSALRIGLRSWDSTREEVAQIDSQRIGWLFLHQALSNARPVADPLATDAAPLFQGDSGGLRFGADMNSYLGLGGLYLVELVREPQGEDTRLLLRRTLLSEYRQRNTENRPQQAVLVDRLGELRIAYYGSEQASAAPAWQSQWHSNEGLPGLVRVDISDADGRRWPTLVAHPRNVQQMAGDKVAPPDWAGQ